MGQSVAVPDYFRPLRGWRVFQLEDGFLYYEGWLWRPGAQTTTCVAVHPHGYVPDRTCTCGIAAYREFRSCLRDMRVYVHSVLGPRCVLVGQIEGWGRAIEHQHGYRFQHARLVRLLDPFGKVSLAEAEAVATRYGMRLQQRGVAAWTSGTR